MFGSKLLKTRLGKGLAVAAVAGSLSLYGPSDAAAQGAEAAEVGKVIPHMLEVPDQSDQVRSFKGLTRTKGLILLFSRSLQW